jgi:hypothetical protein
MVDEIVFRKVAMSPAILLPKMPEGYTAQRMSVLLPTGRSHRHR